ncbi:MAG: hypothetical protein ACKOAD_02355 [Gammaproteobacteria bacterium]
MNKKEYCIAENLNIGFSYPKEYIEFLSVKKELEITSWWLLGDAEGAFEISYEILNLIYQSKKLLIPFAKSDQSNILACFDFEHKVWLTSCEEDDVSNANWENRYFFKDFSEWKDWVLIEKEG